MPSATLPIVHPDILEDLIYDARVGDLESLKSTLESESTKASVSPSSLLLPAIDSDPSDGSGTGCTLLHWPSANGNVPILKFLLSLFQPHVPTVTTTSESKTQSCKELVNTPNKSGNTPLHWAALNGHLECVKMLVEAGGDPTITNEAGHDAVFEAEVSEKEGAKTVAEWLLGHCEGLETGARGQGDEENGGAEEKEGANNATTLADETAKVKIGD